MTVAAFPLSWPAGFPRSAPTDRGRANFGTFKGAGWSRDRYVGKQAMTVADAKDRLITELERLAARNVVISSNLELCRDGTPRSGRRDPDDPGVAIYFHLNGKPHCLPCDRWDRVADNLTAVAKHIEAMRGIARWGVGDVARAFAGFQALPPPSEPQKRTWREVLRFPAGGPVGMTSAAFLEEVEARYRQLARERHPDCGGTNEQMVELTVAIGEARKELRG